MRAVYFDSFGQTPRIEEVAEPHPAPDGVVVSVEATGICRSDWHGWMGHDADVQLPHVPGHELAGTITRVGRDVQHWQLGDRVTVPFAVGCGRCRECVAGRQHICDNYFQPGFTGWGSFAERVAIRYADANLVRLPPEIDFVTAAVLGCRFITAFRAVAHQGQVTGGQWLAVHGCGGVGLSAVMIGAALGAQVIGVDVKENALALARHLGAVHTVNAREAPDVAAAIHELSDGGVHVSVDALGSAETCRNSILSLRKQGRHVQVGLLVGAERDTALPMPAVISRELIILGSHGMPAHDYPQMLAMIRTHRLQPQQLVSRTISLDEAPRALQEMGSFETAGVTVIDRF
jgi:alcohol dehydrogenase